MILIKNNQRKYKIDTEQLKKDIQTILDTLNYSDFDIGILITTNATIRKYNKAFRHKDMATDILSFPFYPTLKAGSRIKAKEEWEKNLGDLILSPEYIKKSAPQYDMSFECRLKVLIVHGICHLLGYDHIDDKDYKKMHKKEALLLRLIQ